MHEQRNFDGYEDRQLRGSNKDPSLRIPSGELICDGGGESKESPWPLGGVISPSWTQRKEHAASLQAGPPGRPLPPPVQRARAGSPGASETLYRVLHWELLLSAYCLGQ